MTQWTGSPELRDHPTASYKSSYVLGEPASIASPYFAAQGALVTAFLESEGKREGVLIQ